MLASVAFKLEGGLDVVEGEVIGEAKRKVLANIENHKQEHKRWVCCPMPMIIPDALSRWKELFLERKEQNKRAGCIAKDAAEGRLRIEADQRYSLQCQMPYRLFNSYVKVSIE